MKVILTITGDLAFPQNGTGIRLRNTKTLSQLWLCGPDGSDVMMLFMCQTDETAYKARVWLANRLARTKTKTRPYLDADIVTEEITGEIIDMNDFYDIDEFYPSEDDDKEGDV